MRSVLFAVCLVMLTSRPAMGQSTSTPRDTTAETTGAASPLQLHTHTSGWGVWIGGSLYSTTFIAKTKDARFGLVGLQFGHVLAVENNIAVRFSADLIPGAVLSYPPPTHPEDADITVTSSPVYGVGAVPVGLQFIYRTDRTVQPFFGGSGGVMYFPAPIPDSRGRKLNYTFDIKAGVRWVLDRRFVFTVGYRFHHLSNGFRGEINPGYDANILYVGLSTM